jgi:hypothetical protein
VGTKSFNRKKIKNKKLGGGWEENKVPKRN